VKDRILLIFIFISCIFR